MISNWDVLADLLEFIERFLHRLRIYTQISPTPAIDKILVNLIVGLISTLVMVTQKLMQRRLREFLLTDVSPSVTQCNAVKFVRNFFAVKDIKAAQKRLERLMQEESRSTAAEVHGRVDGFERKCVDGEQNAQLVIWCPLNILHSRWLPTHRRCP
jgi:hypothetical protein